MNEKSLNLSKSIIDANFVQLASYSLKSRENLFEILLTQRRMPDEGWDELQIEWVLNLLAAMDSNNFVGNVGAGEREARIYSNLVAKRNFRFGHGIGRSGDVGATQPKAAGSSLICKLTKYMVKDALKIAGYLHITDLILLPLATGMSLSLCFMAIKAERPFSKYVICSRIDQKTCIKCIVTAGLIPIILEPKLNDYSYLECNYELVINKIKELGRDNICCVMAVTSCFSPRSPDNVQKLAEISKSEDVPLVVNNAYGVQCTTIANTIENGILRGRVDYVVQSMDKNFMVPVGGAVVFSPCKEKIKKLSSLYPGRASAAPIIDLFITLLQMGENGFTELLRSRKECFDILENRLQEFSQKNGLLLLKNPKNKISFAIALDPNSSKKGSHEVEDKLETNDSFITNPQFYAWSELGGMIYNTGISGARVIVEGNKNICGIEFQNYGSHIQEYPHLPYITIAAAIGMKKEEIPLLISKLEENLKVFRIKKLIKQK